MIVEADAILAAREVALARTWAWDERFLRTFQAKRRGVDCWVVAIDPGSDETDPYSFFTIDGGFSYIVDAETGRCIGVEGMPAFQMFFPDKP